MESGTSRRHLSRSARFSLASLALLGSLTASSVVAVRSADTYLQRGGPPPLRFAPTPAQPGQFTWPAQIHSTQSSSNNQPEPTVPLTSALETNSVAQTNATALRSPMGAPFEISSPALPPISDPNSLSAGNLLLVTPQMLADYFKTNFDPGLRWLTNGFAPMEVPFNPPLPRLSPLSEASYRIQ